MNCLFTLDTGSLSLPVLFVSSPLSALCPPQHPPPAAPLRACRRPACLPALKFKKPHPKLSVINAQSQLAYRVCAINQKHSTAILARRSMTEKRAARPIAGVHHPPPPPPPSARRTSLDLQLQNWYVCNIDTYRVHNKNVALVSVFLFQ